MVKAIELFTIRSNLNFQPEFTSRGFKKFQQKIKFPPARVEPSGGSRISQRGVCQP